MEQEATTIVEEAEDNQSVVLFSRASQMLAEADTIQKAKELKSLALTAMDWARRKGMGEEAIQYARSYALEAERKMGEMLKATERASGKRTDLVTTGDQVEKPTLDDLGISKRESSEAQLLATISLEEFEKVKSGEKTKKAVKLEARRKEEDRTPAVAPEDKVTSGPPATKSWIMRSKLSEEDQLSLDAIGIKFDDMHKAAKVASIQHLRDHTLFLKEAEEQPAKPHLSFSNQITEESGFNAPSVTPSGLPCLGMKFASLAIRDLEKIKENDVERGRSFECVKAWIMDNKVDLADIPPAAAEKGPDPAKFKDKFKINPVNEQACKDLIEVWDRLSSEEPDFHQTTAMRILLKRMTRGQKELFLGAIYDSIGAEIPSLKYELKKAKEKFTEMEKNKESWENRYHKTYEEMLRLDKELEALKAGQSVSNN